MYGDTVVFDQESIKFDTLFLYAIGSAFSCIWFIYICIWYTYNGVYRYSHRIIAWQRFVVFQYKATSIENNRIIEILRFLIFDLDSATKLYFIIFKVIMT